MRHTLPSPKLLAILFFAFLFLAYEVVRYSIRNRAYVSDDSLSQSGTTHKSGLVGAASLRARLYLFSGGIAILLGTMVSSYKEAFLIAGAATFSFGCYFLLVVKKLRRDAATAAKS